MAKVLRFPCESSLEDIYALVYGIEPCSIPEGIALGSVVALEPGDHAADSLYIFRRRKRHNISKSPHEGLVLGVTDTSKFVDSAHASVEILSIPERSAIVWLLCQILNAPHSGAYST